MCDVPYLSMDPECKSVPRMHSVSDNDAELVTVCCRTYTLCLYVEWLNLF